MGGEEEPHGETVALPPRFSIVGVAQPEAGGHPTLCNGPKDVSPVTQGVGGEVPTKTQGRLGGVCFVLDKPEFGTGESEVLS